MSEQYLFNTCLKTQGDQAHVKPYSSVVCALMRHGVRSNAETHPSRYRPTHSPPRIRGSACPSAVMPSTSTWSDPIIQSMWIRLRFEPRAASSSSLMAPPPRMHLL